ncbi:MAG: IS110 family transposase [Candidatus Thiodiazotropha sp. (ex Notomyrtea botanica)]|nr:IS110 family transposase [Candidatus Thiodiazotropha sp. (ex Notomyrtea botanica)]
MDATTIGIDLAKNVFQIHAADDLGKTAFVKRLSRKHFLPFFANLPPCLIGIEVCSSANYWARQLKVLGHDVHQISPQFVKPYVKTNKNDYNDAQAICEAVTQPDMPFVPSKSIEQQDIQAMHRIRMRLVRDRTALVNQTRGLLREYGVFLPVGIRPFREQLPQVLEDADNELTPLTREMIADQAQRLRELDQRIANYDHRINECFKRSETCQRLATIAGVGPIVATALIAAISDIRHFKNGRHLAAWLGLVPRQHSSGERSRLLGISKRGDTYLRTLLIHGARSVISRCDSRSDVLGRWMRDIKERRGFNRASVALANKNARIIWALMAHDDTYRAVV